MLNHYIPPRDFVPFKADFVEPTASDYFIHWLFQHRCIKCRKPASDINEIVPRARSKKSVLTWTNRVTLCRECHVSFHQHGVTDKKIEEMKNLRKEFLFSIGRGEYV